MPHNDGMKMTPLDRRGFVRPIYRRAAFDPAALDPAALSTAGPGSAASGSAAPWSSTVLRGVCLVAMGCALGLVSSPALAETDDAEADPRPQPAAGSTGEKNEIDVKQELREYARAQVTSFGVGGFATPASDFGSEGGVAIGGLRFGSLTRSYSAENWQLELGNGVGFEVEGYSLHNLLELEGAISPIIGGSLIDFDLDVNSNTQSHDYVSWAVHADAGIRLGSKHGPCFIALVGGTGLNSGNQSLGAGDWFRWETGYLVQGLCGPLALGVSARHIDDERGTVAHFVASSQLMFGEKKRFGVGATLSVTGYEATADYASVFESPLLALNSDITQTMIRGTLLFSFDECRAK